MRKWYVINALNGAVIVVDARTKHSAMKQGRSWFGATKLHLYAR